MAVNWALAPEELLFDFFRILFRRRGTFSRAFTPNILPPAAHLFSSMYNASDQQGGSACVAVSF
jgi:hypothetical protein